MADPVQVSETEENSSSPFAGFGIISNRFASDLKRRFLEVFSEKLKTRENTMFLRRKEGRIGEHEQDQN